MQRELCSIERQRAFGSMNVNIRMAINLYRLIVGIFPIAEALSAMHSMHR
jgi:hypothetical protein